MGYLEGGHDGHTMSEQKEGEEKRSPRIEDAKKEMELCITGSGIVGGGRDRGSDRLMWTLLLVSPVAVGCPVGTWNLFLPAFPFLSPSLSAVGLQSIPPVFYAFLCSPTMR